MKLRTEQLLMLGMAMTSNKASMEKRIRGVFSKKRTSAFVCVTLCAICALMALMCFTSACQPKYVDVLVERKPTPVDATTTDDGGDKTLTVYVDWIIKSNDPGIAVRALKAIKEQNPGYEVTFYDPSGGDSTMSLNDQMTRLNTELLVGKGPDILIGSASMFNCTITSGTKDNMTTQEIDVADLGKQMLAGAYLDLAPYLEKDEELSREDFFTDVLDKTVINDKLCGLPLAFKYFGGYTGKETLAATGVNLTGKDSLDTLISECESFLKEQRGEQIYSGMGYTSYLFMEAVAQDMYDYTDSSVKLDKDLLKRILDIYKYDNADKGQEYFYADDNGVADQIAGKYLLYDDHGYYQYQMSRASAFEPNGGAMYIPIRNVNGGVTASIRYYGLINIGTKEPQVAYDSLKAAMKAIFSEIDCMHLGVPILREYADKYFNAESGLVDMKWNPACYEGTMECAVMPEQFFSDFLALADEVTSVMLSPKPSQILIKAFEPYMKGEQSFDKCFDEAEYNLMLFLSE